MNPTVLPHHHHDDHIMEIIAAPLSETEMFEPVSDAFKLLDDSNRLRIFWLLCHVEECVLNISGMMQMTSPAVSHHLKQLKTGGLIVSRREGKEVYYKAANTLQVNLLHETIEKMIQINCPQNETPAPSIPNLSAYQSTQIDTIREVHDYLMENLDRRITIDQLSKQFLMNPTTLKATFKAVYGDSLASHIKEHRMKHAALLLRTTDQSIQQISNSVGYESQSKFSTAFKEVYGLQPMEYRRTNPAKI